MNIRKLLLTLTGLICFFSVHSQNSAPPGGDKDCYQQKSKNHKTAGWVFFTGGMAVVAVGGIIQLHDNMVWKNNTETWQIVPDFRGLYTIFAGGSLALLSTPFFILSGTNKRKAAYLSLNQQQILFYQKYGARQSYVFTVMAAIRL